MAVGSIELGEKRVRGPFSKAVGNVLVVTGVVWKCTVEVTDDVRKVKGVRLRRWEVLVEEYGGRDVGGFFGDGRESGSEQGWGNVFFVRVGVRGDDALCRLGEDFGHFVDFVRVPRCFLRWNSPSIL